MPVSRLVFGSVLLGRAGVRVRSLYIVHMAGGLVVLVAKAGNGGHVVIVFALGTGLVRSVLTRILLDVFYTLVSPDRTCYCPNPRIVLYVPLTLLS